MSSNKITRISKVPTSVPVPASGLYDSIPRPSPTKNFQGTWNASILRNFFKRAVTGDNTLITNPGSLNYVFIQTGDAVQIYYNSPNPGIGASYRAGIVYPIYENGRVVNYGLEINGIFGITPGIGSPSPNQCLQTLHAVPVEWDLNGNPTKMTFYRYSIQEFDITINLVTEVYNEADSGTFTKTSDSIVI